jgi:hypothetical protein
MKNLLSISLIIIYLLGNTEFGQLFNIPKLLDHYKQHHAADHKLCFTQFLVMHYCTDDGTTADDDQDSELPFKQIHQFSFVFFTAPAEHKFSHRNFNAEIKEQNTHFTFQDIEPVYLNTPIQPPRFI